MAEWYYSKDGTQVGPLELEALQKAASNGLIAKADLIWKDGWADWKPASKVSELAAAMVKKPAPAKKAPEPTFELDTPVAYTPQPRAAMIPYHKPVSKSSKQQSGWNFTDFMQFRYMLSVPVMQTLFVVGVVFIVGSILFVVGASFVGAAQSASRDLGLTGFSLGVVILMSLVALVLGVIVWRLYCEFFIVIFRINETLTEIKRELQNRDAH